MPTPTNNTNQPRQENRTMTDPSTQGSSADRTVAEALAAAIAEQRAELGRQLEQVIAGQQVVPPALRIGRRTT
jgi:hypothetical protein